MQILSPTLGMATLVPFVLSYPEALDAYFRPTEDLLENSEQEAAALKKFTPSRIEAAD